MRALVLFVIFSLSGGVFSADPRCSGVPSGVMYLFPYPGDCTRYYECDLDGNAISRTCDADYWFNEALQSCDHPLTSGCIPLTCPPATVDYYSYPSDCTRFIECYHGTAEVHQCDKEFFFNARLKRCVSPDDSECGNYSSSVTPSYTTPSDMICYDVLPSHIVLKPYPGDCQRFYECIGVTVTVISCPYGLYFDEDRQMCDHPGVSSCNATSDVPTTLSPVTLPPFDDPRCATGVTGYWKSIDCDKYVECYEGHGYLMSCPSGLFFNEATKKCESPSVSSCGRVTDPPGPVTTPSAVDRDCFRDGTFYDYLFTYPDDCSKYMECIWGEKIVRDCPTSLYFNPDLEVCDYAWHFDCCDPSGCI